MIKVDLYNLEGKISGDINLPEEVFGLESNEQLVHQVYVAQAANRRSGSSHTKIRSEVRGGGKKPWKQKGTGNARVGSIRNPIWRGGGIVFGPLKERNFSKSINNKMRKKALLIALSEKARGEKVKVVETLNLPEKKTKFFAKLFAEMKLGKSAVVSFNKDEKDNYKAARNIEKINTMEVDQLNVFDLLNSEYLIISKDSVEQIKKKFIL